MKTRVPSRPNFAHRVASDLDWQQEMGVDVAERRFDVEFC
jgi:hypothetical protein